MWPEANATVRPPASFRPAAALAPPVTLPHRGSGHGSLAARHLFRSIAMRARASKKTRDAHYWDEYGLLHQVVAGGRYRRPRGK